MPTTATHQLCLSSNEHFEDIASLLHQQSPNLKYLSPHQIKCAGKDTFLHVNTTSQK